VPRSSAGGPALLFTNVKGSPFRLVTNLFGSARRAELAFGTRPLQLIKRLVHLAETLLPQGVMVVIEARHLCVEMRGVKKPGALTVTSAIRGIFFNRPVREEFLDLLNRRG